jgi:type I restriction enzyme S subunit
MEVREPNARYLVEPAFKQTEVGVIPEDWEVKPLGKVTTLQRGFDLPHRLRKQGSIPIVTSSGIEATHSEAKVIAPGVVTGRYGTIGQVFFVTSDFWPLNTTLYVRDFHGNDPLFISYLLRTIDFHSHSGKSGVPGVNRNDLHEISVGIPRTELEQQAIAEALSDADALIESLEQLLAKKRQIKQGAMQELLTGQNRLPGFAGEWEEKELIELAGGRKELFDDGDWIESEHITTDGIRLIQTGNIGVGCFLEKQDRKYIFESSFVSLRCKELRIGDLLICRLADPAGRACVLPDIGEARMVTSVDVTIFRPPETIADRVFLGNAFSTPFWFQAVSDRSGGTTHKRIARGALGRIKIKLPRIEEQTAIATVLSDLDAELAALETKLAKARQLKQGMMQELLTGRIRLV